MAELARRRPCRPDQLRDVPASLLSHWRSARPRRVALGVDLLEERLLLLGGGGGLGRGGGERARRRRGAPAGRPRGNGEGGSRTPSGPGSAAPKEPLRAPRWSLRPICAGVTRVESAVGVRFPLPDAPDSPLPPRCAGLRGRARWGLGARRSRGAPPGFSEDRWPAFLEKGRELGFVPRITDPLEFAVRVRVLLVMHQPSGVAVDLSGRCLSRKKLWCVMTLRIFNLDVRVPTPEDLIVMKAVARRPRDIADIESILSLHPTLDFKRIRYWVQAFADLMETPDVFTEVDRMLNKYDKSPKKPPSNDHARISPITCPCTSVSRRSMPLWRNVSLVWSMPSRCSTVAWRS